MTHHSITRGMAAYAHDEGGAAASEYALLLTILAGCAVIMWHHLGHNIDRVFVKLAAKLPH